MVDRVSFFKINSYFTHYSRVDKRPRYWHILLLIPFFLRHPKSNISLFRRFLHANSLPNELPVISELQLPSISCLLVVTKKDFINLQDCVEGLNLGSRIPISKFVFITPSSYKEECENAVTGLVNMTNWVVYSDEDIISQESMTKLRAKFGTNFGWVVQQFLTVAYVLASQDEGVLALDGDTILLRPQTWLTHSGQQSLMVSNEFHAPYYELLAKIDHRYMQSNLTFVTHHMLFQPPKMRTILEDIGVTNIDELIAKVISLVDVSVKSPLCIEFELYAQSMYLNFPELVKLTRFSNIPVALPIDQDARTRNLDAIRRSAYYNSISVHSWKNL